MATAERKLKPAEYEITLTLSKDEAQVLFDISGFTAGNPTASRRSLVTAVRESLCPLVDSFNSPADISVNSASLWFKNGNR